MYGIFTYMLLNFSYIYHKNQPNVDKYTIHGPYGIVFFLKVCLYIIIYIEERKPMKLHDPGISKDFQRSSMKTQNAAAFY